MLVFRIWDFLPQFFKVLLIQQEIWYDGMEIQFGVNFVLIKTFSL